MSQALSSVEQPSGHLVWERWLREGIQKLDNAKLLRSLRPIEAIESYDSYPREKISSQKHKESRHITVQTTRHDAQDNGYAEGHEIEKELGIDMTAHGAAKYYDGRGEWDSIGTTVSVSASTLSSWIQETGSKGDLKHTYTLLTILKSTLT